LLQGALAVNEFVNADVIARGLSAFDPDAVAIAAGRVMLVRLRELAVQRNSFAFETTLASRTFAPWLRNLAASGYDIHLVFLWLSSAELAIERVADRVRNGGHNIPVEVVRRRYLAGIRNFFSLYQSLTTTWVIYNSSGPQPTVVAEGLESQPQRVYDTDIWMTVRRQGAP
jgi:predicted ABC-type ATPase